jgi:hypothetical protein
MPSDRVKASAADAAIAPRSNPANARLSGPALPIGSRR